MELASRSNWGIQGNRSCIWIRCLPTVPYSPYPAMLLFRFKHFCRCCFLPHSYGLLSSSFLSPVDHPHKESEMGHQRWATLQGWVPESKLRERKKKKPSPGHIISSRVMQRIHWNDGPTWCSMDQLRQKVSLKLNWSLVQLSEKYHLPRFALVCSSQ